ncbi:MAG: MATE family efflux transporter [Thermodesulfovibrio sp.]|nr:MATE family efflux transporter [Thermodesulfovibrio sp.]
MNMHKQGTDTFTLGNSWTRIWQMSWPMLGIMVFNFFVGLADVYVAGLLGPEIQAAVGFVTQIYFFIIIVANAIATGTLALIARDVGAGNMQNAVGTARQSLLFSIVVGAALSLVTLVLHKEIVAIAGFPLSIQDTAARFLLIFGLSLGPNYVLIISNAIFRASGEVRNPLFTMFIVSAINIVGDFMLVFGVWPFRAFGYQGIAIATSLSVTAGLIISLFLLGRSSWRSIYTCGWTLSLQVIRKIFSIAWPAAILQIAWGAGTIVLYNILGRLGETSIVSMASLTNGLRVEAIIYLPAFALNMAAAVLVGQNLGAGTKEQAASVGWRITGAGMLLVSIMSAVVFVFADMLAGTLTADHAVMKETARYLRLNMLAEPFMAMSAILGGGLQGAGDTRGTMWAIIISMWVIRLPLAYALAVILGYGALGVWVAMVVSMVVQGSIMALRFYKRGWQHAVAA